jgi:G:T-mismatch repair DNA endonuclease (very short patch repair protein)
VGIRHYAPIEAALPRETEGYEWKREKGDIESYKHDQTGGWLHIDQLRDAGWRVLSVWQCETKDEAILRATLVDFLKAGTMR